MPLIGHVIYLDCAKYHYITIGAQFYLFRTIIRVITRERITKDGRETSVIDYILISENLSKFLIEACIDEERLYVLHRYKKTKTGNGEQILSDHNWLFIKSILKFKKSPKVTKKVIFQFRNKDSMNAFREATSNDAVLSTSTRATGITSVNASIFLDVSRKKSETASKKSRSELGAHQNMETANYKQN